MSGARTFLFGLIFPLIAVHGCVPIAPRTSPAGTVTTLVLIRHAERDPGADPPLNAEGLRRAQALVEVLGENGVDVIYTTDLIRNRESVQPLAEHLGVTPRLINPALFVNTGLVAEQIAAEILSEHAGKTVLLCGNRGSVIDTPGITAAMYSRFGGRGAPPDRYQDMYIVVIPDEGDAHFIKTEYGGPSSLD